MKNILYQESIVEIKHLFRMMRNTLLALFVFAGTAFATESYSQTMKVTVVADNMSTGKVISEIEKQTDYLFVYNVSEVNLKRNVKVNAQNKSVAEVLNKVFEGTDIYYAMEGKNILLMSKAKDGEVAQQANKVTGIVKDTNGEPIIGANVTVKGQSIGTITDIDGRFVLDAPKDAVLQITYIGYVSQEVKVSGNKELNVVLKEDTETLDEVVVIGYGTSRKKDITGSIASVRAEELNTVSSSSVSQMLQGKVTGMNAIQSSAQPGASISINIRGAASPNGDNSPLYVIDGVPMQSNSNADPGLSGTGNGFKSGSSRDPLNTINPGDIESIEVLKDASAAAIYGASAANGVILITTKSGKSGKPKVEWRSTVTAQLEKDYPEVLNAHEFREQANLWTKEYYLYQNKMGVYGNNPINFTGYTPVFTDVNDYYAETNWMDEISRSGYVIDQNLSLNGGTEKTKYYFSYNYYNNVGMIKKSDMRRHSIRLNLDQTFSDRLKGGIKMNYSNIKAGNTSIGSEDNAASMVMNALRYAPDIPVRNENGEYTRSYNKLIRNPVAYLETDDKTTTERIFIVPTLDLKLIDGLTLRGVGGFDTQIGVRERYTPSTALDDNYPEGQAQLGSSKVTNISAEAFFNYNKTFGNIHRISAVLGTGYYKMMTSGFGLTGVDFLTDAFGSNNVGIASNKEKEVIRSWRTERVKLSQFARLNYSLKDRYIFTVTARRDGSSYFAENNKWGIFPSASVAWRVNEEVFMKDKTPFSDLKLRIGYGAVGNENVLGSNALSLYTSDTNYKYLIGNVMSTALLLTQIENPDLKWETNYTLNIGLDYGLFNQRISGTIEYFRRGVKDLLDWQILPSNNAVGRVAANIGETKSEGFEFSFRSDNLPSKVLKWETTFNLSYFKTNWVKRNKEVALAEYIGETDELDAIYGWKTDGIITSKEDIPSYMPNANVGNIKYVDINGDGVLDTKDVVKLGNKTPRWFAGLGNTFSYKGFDLNIHFYGAFGYLKERGQKPDHAIIGNNQTAPGNTYKNLITDVYNSQTGQGWMPGVASNPYDSSNPSNTHDFHYMSGNYIKLKNITLGYTLPQKIFANSKFIQGARFFVDAQNIATFTGYEGFDPELSTDNPYPQALSLSFGFNLNF